MFWSWRNQQQLWCEHRMLLVWRLPRSPLNLIFLLCSTHLSFDYIIFIHLISFIIPPFAFLLLFSNTIVCISRNFSGTTIHSQSQNSRREEVGDDALQQSRRNIPSVSRSGSSWALHRKGLQDCIEWKWGGHVHSWGHSPFRFGARSNSRSSCWLNDHNTWGCMVFAKLRHLVGLLKEVFPLKMLAEQSTTQEAHTRGLSCCACLFSFVVFSSGWECDSKQWDERVYLFSSQTSWKSKALRIVTRLNVVGMWVRPVVRTKNCGGKRWAEEWS